MLHLLVLTFHLGLDRRRLIRQEKGIAQIGRSAVENKWRKASGRERKECAQGHVMAGSGGAGSRHGSHGSGACLLVMSLRAAFFFSCLRGCDSLHQLFKLGI